MDRKLAITILEEIRDNIPMSIRDWRTLKKVIYKYTKNDITIINKGNQAQVLRSILGIH
ncbi:hypothetical protein KAR91_04860 [Candidatus Pacearchaeota archaeon]|nr:hypothetical protein [Candidatus Pacearchaeota archaeon]